MSRARVGLIGVNREAASPAAEIFARVQSDAGGVPVLYRALANAPALLDAWIGLGWTLRKDAEADRALCELAVLRVAQLSGSDYVWRSHYRLACKTGLTEAQLGELAQWRSSPLFGDTERALLAVVDELTRDADVCDATWATAATHLGDREAVELVLTAAWYTCVARTVAALRIPLEEHHGRVPAVPDVEVPRKDHEC